MSVPFAGYKDFAACVAANKHKGDADAYCATIMRQVEKYSIKKLDEEQRLVYGWASVVANADGELIEDFQGDLIEPSELEKAAVEFMLEHRVSGEMHQGPTASTVVEAFVASPAKYEAMGIPAEVAKTMPTGFWIGVKTDPATFAKVKTGEFRMFSIEGTARKEPA